MHISLISWTSVLGSQIKTCVFSQSQQSVTFKGNDQNSTLKHFREITFFIECFLKRVAKKHHITQHTVSLYKTSFVHI